MRKLACGFRGSRQIRLCFLRFEFLCYVVGLFRSMSRHFREGRCGIDKRDAAAVENLRRANTSGDRNQRRPSGMCAHAKGRGFHRFHVASAWVCVPQTV
jgi:hypothetical protein